MGKQNDATPMPTGPSPRLLIIGAMPQHRGEQTVGVSSAEIARAVGKTQSTVCQMLIALKTDRLVDVKVIDGKRLWIRTEHPLPAIFTSTADAKERLDAYSDIALREALGVPITPPAVHVSLRLRLVKR